MSTTYHFLHVFSGRVDIGPVAVVCFDDGDDVLGRYAGSRGIRTVLKHAHRRRVGVALVRALEPVIVTLGNAKQLYQYNVYHKSDSLHKCRLRTAS